MAILYGFQWLALLAAILLLLAPYVWTQWPRYFKWHVSLACGATMAAGAVGMIEYPDHPAFPGLLIAGAIVLVLIWFLLARARQEGV